jgi:hypothetical protein
MRFIEYASFLDSCKHIIASAWHFGRMMRRHDSFEKYCNDKTKRCGIERFQDSFNIYGNIWKDIGV